MSFLEILLADLADRIYLILMCTRKIKNKTKSNWMVMSHVLVLYCIILTRFSIIRPPTLTKLRRAYMNLAPTTLCVLDFVFKQDI